MEEEQKKENPSNLPVIQKDKSLGTLAQKTIMGISDLGRKFLKITGATTIALGGLVLSGVSIPLAETLGIGISIYAGVRAGMNMLYKTEPGLMFMSRKKLSGERQIYQDTRPDLAANMRDFSIGEKAGMMGLQTLVGFSRYKESLKGTPFVEREDGVKVYNQKYSTVTHSVNLKNFEMLEKLGLIEIESMNEIPKNQGIIGKLTGEKEGSRKSLLIAEKIGFRNWSSLAEIAKAAIKRDNKTLEENRVLLKKVSFRLTDKPIDFEDMYLKLNGAREFSNKEERIATRRFFTIFTEGRGILAKKGIDIKKDTFGRDTLVYNSKESFAERMQATLEQGRKQKEIGTTEVQDSKQLQNEQFLDKTHSRVDRTEINRKNEQVISQFFSDEKENKETSQREDKIQDNGEIK